MNVLYKDCKFPTKGVDQSNIESALNNKIKYTKVYCSKCLNGEIVYKKIHQGLYCTNIQCENYLIKKLVSNNGLADNISSNIFLEQ